MPTWILASNLNRNSRVIENSCFAINVLWMNQLSMELIRMHLLNFISTCWVLCRKLKWVFEQFFVISFFLETGYLLRHVATGFTKRPFNHLTWWFRHWNIRKIQEILTWKVFKRSPTWSQSKRHFWNIN